MNKLTSQSETDALLSCERKHYYAFGEPCADGSFGIAPNGHSDSLTRGNIGHAILDDLYTAERDGLSRREASQSAIMEHNLRMMEDMENAALYNQILQLFVKYVTHYEEEDKNWEPVAIEHEFRYKIPNSDLVFPFKPDLIRRHKLTGKVDVVDHKFIYNYYNDKMFTIMPQLAKYVSALKRMGYPVDTATYNQISTRQNSKEPFRRSPADIGEVKSETFFREQAMAMARVDKLKTMPNEEWKASVLRTASAFNCKNCMFLDLCTLDLTGANGRELHIRQYYEPNKYGYGKGEVEEESSK